MLVMQAYLTKKVQEVKQHQCVFYDYIEHRGGGERGWERVRLCFS